MKRSFFSMLTTVLCLLALGACAKKPVSPLAENVLPAVQTEAMTGSEVSPADLRAEPVAEAGAAGSSLPKLDKVLFEYDSYTLSARAREILTRNAEWLRQNPEVRLTIEGHCDERGSDEYNLALGQRRAEAVRTYLQTLGIAPERLPVISFGEEKPAVAGHDESAWEQNRRAEFM